LAYSGLFLFPCCCCIFLFFENKIIMVYSSTTYYHHQSLPNMLHLENCKVKAGLNRSKREII
jgi:hypothetical protein